MALSPEELEQEIRKLRGLLQLLHEDQPDVMEDIFAFHVGTLVSHSAPDQHASIRMRARQMLAEVQALPRRVETTRGPVIGLMPAELVPAT